MNRYELANALCELVRAKRLRRAGEPLPIAPANNALDNLPREDRENWLNMADAALEILHNDTDVGRLRALADDWTRYGTLHDREWCNEMRRAVVVEMRVLIDQLWGECQ